MKSFFISVFVAVVCVAVFGCVPEDGSAPQPSGKDDAADVNAGADSSASSELAGENAGMETSTVQRRVVESRESVETEVGHVNSLIWSPDGGQVVVVGEGLAIIDPFTRQIQRRLGGSERLAAAFSPDAKRLAVLHTEASHIAFVDPLTGESTSPLLPVPDKTRGIAWSPDGKVLATVGGQFDKPEFALWEVAGNRKIHDIDYPGESLNKVVFSPDSKTVIAFGGSDLKELLLWNVESGKQAAKLTGHESWPVSVAVSEDGGWLASGTDSVDNKIRLWDLDTFELVRTFQGYTEEVSCLTFTPNSKWVVSGGSDRTIRIWDPLTGQRHRTLWGHQWHIVAVDVSPDGRWIASVVDSGTVRFWNLERALDNPDLYRTTGDERVSIDADADGGVNSLSVSGDGKWMVTGSLDAVRLWDVTERRVVHTCENRTGGVLGVAIANDGGRFAYVRQYGGIDVYETASGEKLHTLNRAGKRLGSGIGVKGPVLSPDDSLVAAAEDGFVVLWEIKTGKPKFEWKAHDCPIYSLVFFPEGKRLASGGEDTGEIRIWDVSGEVPSEPLHKLDGHRHKVLAMAVTTDGHLLASSAFDENIRIWNADTGEFLRTIDSRTTRVEDLQFLPGGTTLAVPGGEENIARSGDPIDLWDADTGRHIRTLRGHRETIWSLAVTSDGQTLFSGSDDGTIKLWDANAR